MLSPDYSAKIRALMQPDKAFSDPNQYYLTKSTVYLSRNKAITPVAINTIFHSLSGIMTPETGIVLQCRGQIRC